MPQTKVTMTVRKPNDEASIVDIQGEVTAFAESALIGLRRSFAGL